MDLVTGGAGFIGSHLVEGLLEKGRSVRILDDFSTGSWGNLEHLSGRIEALEGDVRDVSALEAALKGVERVFHLAARTSVEESVRHPERTQSVNLGGTLKLLQAATREGVTRLVLASSTAVYGNQSDRQDESQMTQPCSAYGLSKLAAEHYCRIFHQLHGLPTISLRFFNVYGPRQDPHSPYAAVVPRFITRLLNNRSPIIFGDGHQTRDFVFVSDVVTACLKAAACEAAGEAYNVGSGRSTSIVELASLLNQLCGRVLSPAYRQARAGEIRHCRAATERCRTSIGYSPNTPLEEGLRRTVDWYREEVNQRPEGKP